MTTLMLLSVVAVPGKSKQFHLLHVEFSLDFHISTLAGWIYFEGTQPKNTTLRSELSSIFNGSDESVDFIIRSKDDSAIRFSTVRSICCIFTCCLSHGLNMEGLDLAFTGL